MAVLYSGRKHIFIKITDNYANLTKLKDKKFKGTELNIIKFINDMMAVKITYFVHGTTTDNERDLATGWSPGKLSGLGINQAKELGKLVSNKHFDVVFCSDLKRAVDSAELLLKTF